MTTNTLTRARVKSLRDKLNFMTQDPPYISSGEPIETVMRFTLDDWKFAIEALEALLPQQEAVADGYGEKLKKISMLLHSQDNRCTADPIFAVRQKRRRWGIEEPEDDYAFINAENDYETVERGDPDFERLDALDDNFELPKEWRKSGYVDEYEFVTACFTEQGCKDYLARNGHNLNEPEIYAYSAYRNQEFIEVRNFLKSLLEPLDKRGKV